MDNEIWKTYRITHIGANQFSKESRINKIYEVSNLGRVKINGVIKEGNIDGNGYIRFSGFRLHRAVAELFIPNPENKPQIDHINGNKLDNRVTNLRWVTGKENMQNPITYNKIKGTHRVYLNPEKTKWKYVR